MFEGGGMGGMGGGIDPSEHWHFFSFVYKTLIFPRCALQHDEWNGRYEWRRWRLLVQHRRRTGWLPWWLWSARPRVWRVPRRLQLLNPACKFGLGGDGGVVALRCVAFTCCGHVDVNQESGGAGRGVAARRVT